MPVVTRNRKNGGETKAEVPAKKVKKATKTSKKTKKSEEVVEEKPEDKEEETKEEVAKEEKKVEEPEKVEEKKDEAQEETKEEEKVEEKDERTAEGMISNISRVIVLFFRILSSKLFLMFRFFTLRRIGQPISDRHFHYLLPLLRYIRNGFELRVHLCGLE